MNNYDILGSSINFQVMCFGIGQMAIAKQRLKSHKSKWDSFLLAYIEKINEMWDSLFIHQFHSKVSHKIQSHHNDRFASLQKQWSQNKSLFSS